MCAQCMAAAATTAAAATGIRAWLAARRPDWLGARRLRRISAGLLAGAVVGAGLLS